MNSVRITKFYSSEDYVEMKKYRIFALVLAALMLTLTFAACNKDSGSPTVTVNCHVKINGTDASIVNFDVAVEGTEEAPPTVLDAAIAALNRREDVKYELDMNDEGEAIGFISITDDSGNVYKVGYTDATNEYLATWEYTLDGITPDSGRMNKIPVTEGQQIEFSFNTYSVAELAAANP